MLVFRINHTLRTNPKEEQFTVTKVITRRAGSRNPATKTITEYTGSLDQISYAFAKDYGFRLGRLGSPATADELVELVDALNRFELERGYSDSETFFKMGSYETPKGESAEVII